MTSNTRSGDDGERKLVAALQKAVEQLDIQKAALYLILAWMSKRTINGGTYPIHEEMVEELRSVAARAVEQVQQREMAIYRGPTLLSREQGLWVPANRINVASPLFTMLKTPDALRDLRASELVKRSLALFAIGMGSTQDNRFFFVTKNARNIRGDTAILGILRGALRPVKNSVLVLRKSVDFILHDKGAVVFNAQAFERFLQDPADTEAQLDQHLDAIATSLPFDVATLDALKDRGRQGTMFRLRIRSIVDGGNLPHITLDKLGTVLTGLKKDASDYIVDGKLAFTIEQAPFVLSVLDDSAWVGPFSGKVFTSVAATAEE